MSTPTPVKCTYNEGRLTSITIAPQGLSTVTKAMLDAHVIVYSSPSGVSQQYAAENGEATLCGLAFRMDLADAVGPQQARMLWDEMVGGPSEVTPEREEVRLALISIEEWKNEGEEWRYGDEYAHINTDLGVWAL